MPDERDASIRLLLVEDDPDDARLMEAQLGRSGLAYSCRRVETEPEFRQELARFRPDLILSDYTMPHFDGMSALRVAREQAPTTPFVFYSGTIGEERAIEALKSGAVDYVLKDHPLRLVPAIRRALREAEDRAAASRMERIQGIFGQLSFHWKDEEELRVELRRIKEKLEQMRDEERRAERVGSAAQAAEQAARECLAKLRKPPAGEAFWSTTTATIRVTVSVVPR